MSAASAVAAVRRRGAGAGDGAATTNLPTVLRPLIGRDEQLDSLSQMLGGVRLLSLIGPGGAGKTSLALATAVRSLPRLLRRSVRRSAGIGGER